MPSIVLPCNEEEITKYERTLVGRLYDMKACLTECLINNPTFDISFIKDELKIDRAIWKAKECLSGGGLIKKEGGVVSVNPKVKQLWKDQPETRIPDIMVGVIEEAERFVNKEYLCFSQDEKIEESSKQVSHKAKAEEKSVLNVSEVVERFGLPYNNVKDKQWRDRNGFPYRQVSKGGKVVFYTDEIEEWLESRKAS